MSRGKKLDIFIGAEIEDGWASIGSQRKTELQEEILHPQKHFLYFQKEKRRGKVVTLVGRFYLENESANTLLSKIKKALGCGGTYKEGFMEFQGELKEKLRPLLAQEDFRFKNGH